MIKCYELLLIKKWIDKRPQRKKERKREREIEREAFNQLRPDSESIKAGRPLISPTF